MKLFHAVACTDFLKGRGKNIRVLCSATEKGSLARVLAPKRTVYHVLTSQEGSLVSFANQEGTLVHILAPKRTVYHVLTSQGGSLVCFAPRGTLYCILTP